MAKYAIGIDFGTLSGRGLLVDVQTGEEVATSEYEYPHAVMDACLPSGKKLGHDWALQHPQDYLEVLQHTIPDMLGRAGVAANDVISIGVDFTACTVLPVLQDGTPLCFRAEYADEPHAYVKLWKHHAAQKHANKLNETAHARGEKWIDRYGGKISSEWMFPKLWQILDEAPDLYDAMDKFIEAGDWLVWQLTGKECRSASIAGYKAIWSKQDGYPSNEFFAALDPRLEHVVDEKLSREFGGLGECAGGLTKEMAQKTGLLEGTPVAVAITDATCLLGLKITKPGKMMSIIGTSTCDMLMCEKEQAVPGICGYVEDGLLPGYYGYEAGQSCMGDHFSWFVKNCVPRHYYEEAEKQGLSIHTYLQKLTEGQKPGQSGLLALDWWNGNRSVLVDVDLTGMMLGMTLRTKAEEIYRALVEATAYGLRMIVENFEEHGVPVDEIYAAGGIAEKSAFVMQIYADVLKRPIKISGSAQAPALTAAMFGTLCAGKAAGGYDDVEQVAEAMGKLKDIVYTPIQENAGLYDKLYAEYFKLHEYFGRGENDVMKRLKQVKADVSV